MADRIRLPQVLDAPSGRQRANESSRSAGKVHRSGPDHASRLLEAKAAETFPGEEEYVHPVLKRTDDTTTGALVGAGAGAVAGAGIGALVGGPMGALVGGAIGGGAGALGGLFATAKPSLSLSGDTYTDSATDSRKNIQFDVAVPWILPNWAYVLVNWIKGSMKDGTGKPFKVTMYGSSVDADFASWQVDSVDADPVYWSDSTGRWNYTTTPTGFFATDSPGPALSTELGAVYDLDFKIGLYRRFDVPDTTTGTISATPIEEKPWRYSVKVDPVTGAFTHP